ncbi:COR domain-containing protein [Methanosarcina sp. Mfa9]|uniref:leucine-rich repeat domain-containing protein n=1 Tax=Methanosarcina sp. Mfa9 TaxID=3439063 RepID=UPI003F872FB5
MESSEIKDLIRWAQRRNVTVLDLSNRNLTSLPPEISELEHLTKLNISNNQLTLLPSEFKELKNLRALFISGNQLTSLSPEITELKNLSALYMSRNQLTSLPSEITELKNLKAIDISGNLLNSLPPEITELKNLTKLDICGNQLTFLPPEITELKNLTKLYMSNNLLTFLPSEIVELNNLTILYLDDNQLTSLPPKISGLKNLTILYLDNNQLTSLPSEISGLKNLTELSLHNNQLTSLPSEISGLKNLTKLYLGNNQLISLPPEISGLKNLTKLYLGNNKLTSLPPEILELGLEVELEKYWEFNIIYLKGNPIENPPVEIIKKGRGAVFNYFKSLEDEKEPLNEVKVLLVGDGGAGKTSLVKRLLGEGFDGNEHQTQGINIKGWEFKNKDKEIKINFWDFGGQEIMHATHQFFLSKRSLYILVLNSRRDEKAEYWLKHIRSFGGDSSVLVVLNKIDENPSFELNRKFLQEKYPSIKGFFRISCKDNRGIEVFSSKIKKEILKVEHLQIEWAKSWFNVKTRLENMNCDFITYDKYRNMCMEENVGDKSSQNTLVDFLNDLGVILHFKDISLLDTHVLEPRWITNGVYRIINSETLVKRKGVLRFGLLDEILKQKNENDYYYPPTRYNYIINLMKKFELCYTIDEQTVLLPDLLAVPEPNFDFDSNEALNFFIEYDFLPRSVMPRFIVKMNRDIKDNLQWRTGVVLENKDFNSCAVIKSDNEAKRIYISVNGGQKRDYFSSILFNLREINRSFEKLKAVEKIPVPDEPDVAVSYDHLVYLEEVGEDKYRPEGSRKAYSVRDLLGTVNNGSKQEELLEEILHILKKRNEEDKMEEIVLILSNLAKTQARESDDRATLSRKLNKTITLQPNVMGFGFDFNAAIDEALDRYYDWKNKKM